MSNNTNLKGKTLAIVGPSGVQGASVLHHFLKTVHPTTQIRTLTQSPKFQRQRSLPNTSQHPNLSIFQTDFLSPDSLKFALAGCDYVFANTNSSDPRFVVDHANGLPEEPREFEAIRNIVDACAECKVGLLVLSTIEDIALAGTKSSAFVAKSMGRRYAEKIHKEGKLNLVVVTLGWYFSNFLSAYRPNVNKNDDVVEFHIPWGRTDVKVPWVSTYTDLGPVVKVIMDDPTPYLGKVIPVAVDHMSLEELARGYQEVTGQQTRVIHRNSVIAEYGKNPNPEEVPEHLFELYYIMAVYNSGRYLAGYQYAPGKYMELEGLLERSGLGKLTTWEKWLRDTGFNAKKKGLGKKISELVKAAGGQNFV